MEKHTSSTNFKIKTFMSVEMQNYLQRYYKQINSLSCPVTSHPAAAAQTQSDPSYPNSSLENIAWTDTFQHWTCCKYPLNVYLPSKVSKLIERDTFHCERASFIILQLDSFINRLYLQLLPGSPTPFSIQNLAISGWKSNQNKGPVSSSFQRHFLLFS